MKKQKYDWPQISRDLRARPGEWARVVDPAPSKRAAQDVTRYIKRGSVNMPPGVFGALTRDDVVYAKYIGGSSDA